MPPLDVVDQGESNWCWASVTAAILNWRDGTHLQPCEVAGQVMGQPCCQTPHAFNHLHELSDALDEYHLLRETRDHALDEQELADEVKHDPVGARIVFQNGRVHFVVIIDVQQDGTVIVADPDGPQVHYLSHARMRFNYPGGGIWNESYLIQ